MCGAVCKSTPHAEMKVGATKASSYRDRRTDLLVSSNWGSVQVSDGVGIDCFRVGGDGKETEDTSERSFEETQVVTAKRSMQ